MFMGGKASSSAGEFFKRMPVLHYGGQQRVFARDRVVSVTGTDVRNVSDGLSKDERTNPNRSLSPSFSVHLPSATKLDHRGL